MFNDFWNKKCLAKETLAQITTLSQNSEKKKKSCILREIVRALFLFKGDERIKAIFLNIYGRDVIEIYIHLCFLMEIAKLQSD